MEKVSIIIPYYKKKEFIFNCINSILKQTYQNFEIIIVNDECSRKSKILLHEISKKDARIKVFNKMQSNLNEK